MGTLAAIRQQRYRERQRDGKIMLLVKVDEVALAEALVAAGFLGPASYDDRGAIKTALEHVIQLWTQDVTRNGAGFRDWLS